MKSWIGTLSLLVLFGMRANAQINNNDLNRMFDQMQEQLNQMFLQMDGDSTWVFPFLDDSGEGFGERQFPQNMPFQFRIPNEQELEQIEDWGNAFGQQLESEEFQKQLQEMLRQMPPMPNYFKQYFPPNDTTSQKAKPKKIISL
jgi:hypothetical protein